MMPIATPEALDPRSYLAATTTVAFAPVVAVDGACRLVIEVVCASTIGTAIGERMKARTSAINAFWSRMRTTRTGGGIAIKNLEGAGDQRLGLFVQAASAAFGHITRGILTHGEDIWIVVVWTTILRVWTVAATGIARVPCWAGYWPRENRFAGDREDLAGRVRLLVGVGAPVAVRPREREGALRGDGELRHDLDYGHGDVHGCPGRDVADEHVRRQINEGLAAQTVFEPLELRAVRHEVPLVVEKVDRGASVQRIGGRIFEAWVAPEETGDHLAPILYEA